MRSSNIRLAAFAVAAALVLCAAYAVCIGDEGDAATGNKNIIFKSGGGTGSMTPVSVDVSSAVEIAGCTFTKAGYEFDYWVGSDGKTYHAQRSYTFDNNDDLTLTAVWKASTYTVAFEVGQGGILNKTSAMGTATTITVTFNTSFGTLPTAEKQGYRFIGWNTVETPAEATVSETAVMSSTVLKNVPESSTITLYAQYVQTYMLTFVTGFGDDYKIASQTVDAGKKFTKPSFNKVGYAFDGWFTTAEFTTAFDFNAIPSEDKTAYAKTTELDKVRITFVPNNGQGLITKESYMTYTLSDVTISNPSKDGYDFAGWYRDSALESKMLPTDRFSGDMTLYAKYTEKAQKGFSLDDLFSGDSRDLAMIACAVIAVLCIVGYVATGMPISGIVGAISAVVSIALYLHLF